MRPVLVGAEAIVAFGQGQRHLPGCARRPVVAAIGRAAKGIDRQPNLGIAICVPHRDDDRDRRRHHRRRASWNSAIVRIAAPKVRPVLVGAETIVAFGQGQRHLPGCARRPVVAAIGRAAIGIDRQPNLGAAILVRIYLKFAFSICVGLANAFNIAIGKLVYRTSLQR